MARPRKLPHVVAQLPQQKSRTPGTQKTLIADKQKVTQDLRVAVQEGRNLAINVRAIAKGEVGSRSEKLVEFGVAPLRPRTRKRKPPQGPDELDRALGATALSA